MMRNFIFIPLYLLFLSSVFIQGIANAGTPKHPRGLITVQEAEAIRLKVKNSPYDEMLKNVEREVIRLQADKNDIYALADLTKFHAFLYLVTKDKKWADSSFQNFKILSLDTAFVKNPFSKGLTRAYVLREMAYAYDFCFDAWSEGQRKMSNNALYDLMSSVNNNMGKMANYHIESNWMGVRYGSVAFAANIIDEDYLDQNKGSKKIDPFKWDAKYRLQDHIEAAFTSNGWFVETMGYQDYDWSFVVPALISLQHSTSSSAFDLDVYAPNLLHALDQHLTATLSLPNGSSVGIKPDLGNDNPNTGISLFAFGVRLMPEEMKPALKWMINYLTRPEYNQDDFLKLALCPEDLEVSRPENEYLNYVDSTVGVTLFRNEFKNENDIVACFNTTAKRFPGHGGPDNLTFRIMGLGSIWAIGAGRTGEVAGQTNLFTAGNMHEKRVKGMESTFLGYQFDSGSGYAMGKGNCMGVKDHIRTFHADFTGKMGASAVFIVKDQSTDGRVWRLNTPEFNQVEVLKNGFLITAPNGATLRATVPGDKDVVVNLDKVRYGGSTVSHNSGIGFNGKHYSHTHAIDILCKDNITVVMTLQPKGQRHPEIDPQMLKMNME